MSVTLSVGFQVKNVRADPVNFGALIHILGIAEDRAVKFCTQGDCCISSLAKRMINHPIGGHGLAHVTHFCIKKQWI